MLFFFAYFSVSKKRNIKRSPNGMKPSGAIFLETQSRRLGVDVKQRTKRPRGWTACPKGVGAPPTLVGPSSVNRPTPSSYIYPRTPKTSRGTTKNYFHRRYLLYPRDPSWSLRRRSVGGGIDHGVPLHHPGGYHDEEGVVHPQG